VNAQSAPPGWYPDPSGGGRRYFDGTAWTPHTAPYAAAAPPPWVAAQPWKGARLGRPPYGSGSLSDPGRRLGARLLDGLIFVPVYVACAAIAIALVAPHAGPMFPSNNTDPNVSPPTPGFIWIYLALFGASVVAGALFVLYETVFTVKWGRTLGKRWMAMRPLTTTGEPLGWGRAFGRSSVAWLFGWLGWLGLLDPLWCLWDGDRQCLHDKTAGTLVVDD
jgi:uncharacterized RDD family membrane protein YckC